MSYILNFLFQKFILKYVNLLISWSDKIINLFKYYKKLSNYLRNNISFKIKFKIKNLMCLSSLKLKYHALSDRMAFNLLI